MTIKRIPALITWITLVTTLSGCSQLFFFPDKRLILEPDRIGLKYANLPVTTADGARLHGWFLPGAAPVKGTVIFLHGNAQNISYHIASVHWLPEQHFNVYLYDYRGYGNSGGDADIDNAIADFADIMRHLRKTVPVAEQKFIVFGQSLGGALAIASVARHQQQHPVALLVVDSGFSGFRRIAREKLREVAWLRPFNGVLGLTIQDKPDLLQEIAAISPTPVIIIHGLDDTIVPPHHGQALFDAARGPRQLWLEPDAKHILSLSHAPLRARLLEALDQAVKPAGE